MVERAAPSNNFSSVGALRAFAAAARPGAAFVYWTGALARDADAEAENPARAKAARAVREEARAMAAGGTVALFQRRLGPDAYAYIAVRRGVVFDARVGGRPANPAGPVPSTSVARCDGRALVRRPVSTTSAGRMAGVRP